MKAQVFMSHTKLDSECCDKFDSAAARVGLKVFRSEFEEIGSPAWKTIKDEVDKSSALFLLVGKELVGIQKSSNFDSEHRESWKFTQNWISYEVGLACQRGIDVWVICDNVRINFPVHYLNNYDVWGIRREVRGSLKWIKWVFNEYSEGNSFPVGRPRNWKYVCPHCGVAFNLHSTIHENEEVPCPSCLGSMHFANGWLLRRLP